MNSRTVIDGTPAESKDVIEDVEERLNQTATMLVFWIRLSYTVPIFAPSDADCKTLGRQWVVLEKEPFASYASG